MTECRVSARVPAAIMKVVDDRLIAMGHSRAQVVTAFWEHLAKGGSIPFELSQVPKQDRRSIVGRKVAAQETRTMLTKTGAV